MSKKAPRIESRSVRFVKSAVYPEDYPQTGLPEIVITGRSNAGKSSFINTWTGSKIALVSQNPGKTRLLNFFNVENKYMLVDTPGYGFAVRSGGEVQAWQKMIEDYLVQRETLKGLVLLMDIRRDWSPEEELLKKFCNEQELGIYVVLTKSDKVSQSEQKKLLREKQQDSGLLDMAPCSALKKTGIQEIEKEIFENWLREFIP